MKTAAIILNYDFEAPVTETDIICADGGYNFAKAKGLKVKTVVGDLDSARDIESGIEIIKFDRKKDMTDGELAVRYAISAGYQRLSIYGAEGGKRLDHIMSNIVLLGIAAKLGAKCVIKGAGFDAYFVNSTFELDVERGDVVSIVPFSDELHIIGTEGLEYEIKDKIINKYLTLGVSNVAIKERVKINVVAGEAIVFRVFAREV